VRTVYVIGIGAGDPEHLTLQAVAAMNRADVFFTIDKGEAKGELAALRATLLARHVTRPHRVVTARDPERDRSAPSGRYAGAVADWHFAPTDPARQNLLREGVSESSVFVTGNTIVDALRSIPLEGAIEDRKLDSDDFDGHRVLLVTAHRRENHGPPLVAICEALKQLAVRFPDIEVVYPVHLNPNVRGPVREVLGSTARVHLVDPVSYGDLLRLMRQCFLILTDSGGIQEEAPSFHKPVLILREVTERPEVVEVGAGRIVGTDTGRIVEETARLLDQPGAYAAMSSAANPFGDGRAAERIVDILATALQAAG